MPNLQKKKSVKDEVKATDLSGLKFRSVGPAFMSGRIADIAINPENENEWYVAVGSGGVWKTNNSGTTWQPIADSESFYSTGCITIDPNSVSVYVRLTFCWSSSRLVIRISKSSSRSDKNNFVLTSKSLKRRGENHFC